MDRSTRGSVSGSSGSCATCLGGWRGRVHSSASRSIPSPRACSIAARHAAASVAPSARMTFSPFQPSTAHVKSQEKFAKAVEPIDQRARRRRRRAWAISSAWLRSSVTRAPPIVYRPCRATSWATVAVSRMTAIMISGDGSWTDGPVRRKASSGPALLYVALPLMSLYVGPNWRGDVCDDPASVLALAGVAIRKYS